MEISDNVYGAVKIEEPVLIKLINSKPVQRLKGISQTLPHQCGIKGHDVTRYDHSVGVMILLRKLGAPLEEQVAGLMHDIPHTAFSHVADFVFNNKEQDYHERFHEKIITSSEIPRILEGAGFKLERLLNEHNFPLLERKLPDLCADRIDYFLRDMIAYYGFQERIRDYLVSLVVKDGEIVFREREIARKFAEDYLMVDEQKWSHPFVVAIFQLLADAIRIALDEKILVEEDLFQDDAFVYSKLKESGNPEILEKLGMLNPNLKITDDPDSHHFLSFAKVRYIDPKFTNTNGSIGRVSEAYPDFQERINRHNESVKRGNFIRIVSW
jgi:hypothetical protein